MQLEQFLEQAAARAPGRTAIVCGDRRISYADLEADANRLAHAFLERGIERGDRVAICLENSIEAAIAIFATLKAGAVFMPIHPTTKPDKLAYLLNNSRAAALVCGGHQQAMLTGVLPQTPHLRQMITVGGSVEALQSAAVPLAAVEDILADTTLNTATPPKRCISIDLAALIYTSGSTGNAKGVMLTHLNMVTAATSITTYLENREDDVILNVLPMSFDYGLYQLLMSVRMGATLVLERGFTFLDELLQVMVRERVTGLPLVPTIAAMLLQFDLGEYDLSSLRYITNTAAALPTEHIHQLRDRFPQARLFSMYGLTECKRVSYLPPDQLDIRPDSVGRGMPNQEVFLVDEDDVRLPNGSVGELVVRGAHVMKGYWENPAETAERLKPGPLPGEMQLHTGDLFRSDEEGYLYFVGRRDDIIKTRGEKVAPREVENALCRHPDVLEATVFAVADELLGSAIHACVTLRSSGAATPQQLRRHCAAHLEEFMVPQVVTIREQIPRTPNGKFDRRLLASLATQRQTDPPVTMTS
jgi:long-chain acyl-CoA synthetase